MIMLFALRVTSGQEKVVSEMVYTKVRKQSAQIYSVSTFDGLKGYIIIEAVDENSIRTVIKGLSHIRGVVGKETVDIKEIENLIQAAKSPITKIAKGDIIEIVGGPFKGERAIVKRTDESKDEITVELIEAAVPIPVTIKVDMVKMFKKVQEEE